MKSTQLLLSLLLLFLNSFTSVAQTFFKKVTANKDLQTNFYDACATADGGALVAGWLYNDSFYTTSLLYRFGEDGTLLQAKKLQLGSKSALDVRRCLELKNGDVVTISTNWEPFVSTILTCSDKNLNMKWAFKMGKYLKYPNFNKIIELDNGNIAFIGRQIIVLRPDGKVVWEKRFEAASFQDEYVAEVGLKTQDNALVLSYYLREYDPNNSFEVSNARKIIKISANDGKIVWEKTYPRQNVNYFKDVLLAGFEDKDGNLIYYIRGFEKLYVFKLNASGDWLWTKDYNTVNIFGNQQDMMQKKDKTFVIHVQSTYSNKNYFLHLDSDGEILDQYEEPLTAKDSKFAIKIFPSSDGTMFFLYNTIGSCQGLQKTDFYLQRRKPNGENNCTQVSKLSYNTETWLPYPMPIVLKEGTPSPLIPTNEVTFQDYPARVLTEAINCLDTTYINRCEKDTVLIKGKIYLSDTIRKIKFASSQCDSTVLYKVTFFKPSSTTIDTTIFEDESIDFAGKTYNEAGTFEELLTSKIGCDSSLTLRLQTKRRPNPKVFIPNAFSPNGDNNNDVLKVFANEDLEKILNFQVFDRWGNLVHKEQNVKVAELQGWDGTYRGQVANREVYVYFVEIELKDGTKKVFKGDVLLAKN